MSCRHFRNPVYTSILSDNQQYYIYYIFCDVRIGQYIAVVYDTKWCIAIIKQKCSITADRMLFYETPSIQSGFIVLAREEGSFGC